MIAAGRITVTIIVTNTIIVADRLFDTTTSTGRCAGTKCTSIVGVSTVRESVAAIRTATIFGKRMEAGRYHLGEEVAFGIMAKNASSIPISPDAAPTFSVYTASGTKLISDKKFPPVDRASLTGVFGYAQFLGMTFAAGQYLLYVKWVSSGFNGRYLEKFEVMPGGNAGGNVIAMTEFRKPHNTYIVRQLTSGIISAGRNPRL